MRRLPGLTAVLMALLFLAALGAPAAAYTPPGDVRIAFDRTEVSGSVGDRITLPTTVTNSGTAPTGPLIAHLNVASLTRDVYVDPEDWSSSRSTDLPPIRPGGHVTLTWHLQAVNAGSFDVYVVLLPAAASAGAGPLVVSPPVHVRTAARQSVSAGGVLPVAVAMPILLGLIAVVLRRRPSRTGPAVTVTRAPR